MAGGCVTTSYYEVLEVSADASHDLIKRAYVDATTRLRSETTGRSSSERAEALARVDQAWAVLGSIVARAAYDRDLARATTTVAQRREADRPFTDHATELVPASPPAPVRASRRWPWAAVVIAVVVVVAFAGRTVVSEPDDIEVATTEEFAPGACVLLEADRGAVRVPCTADHDGRVIERVEFPSPCPIGSRSVVLMSEGIQLCVDLDAG